jgi:hypothetical protein
MHCDFVRELESEFHLFKLDERYRKINNSWHELNYEMEG